MLNTFFVKERWSSGIKGFSLVILVQLCTVRHWNPAPDPRDTIDANPGPEPCFYCLLHEKTPFPVCFIVFSSFFIYLFTAERLLFAFCLNSLLVFFFQQYFLLHSVIKMLQNKQFLYIKQAVSFYKTSSFFI